VHACMHVDTLRAQSNTCKPLTLSAAHEATPAGSQPVRLVQEFNLSRGEKLQLANLHPTRPVDIHLVCLAPHHILCNSSINYVAVHWLST
jgi:hypothetical protein